MLGRLHRWRAMRASVLAMAIGGSTAGCHQSEGRGVGHGFGGHGFGGRGYASPEACAERARSYLEDLAAWVDVRLDLDADQRSLLGEVERTATDVAGELGSLCAHPEGGDVESMLAFGETALADSLDGYRRVRPALEAFVASLGAEQRAQLGRWLEHRHGRGNRRHG